MAYYAMVGAEAKILVVSTLGVKTEHPGWFDNSVILAQLNLCCLVSVQPLPSRTASDQPDQRAVVLAPYTPLESPA